MAGDVGERISDLIDQDRWTEARKLILSALKNEPDDHWLLDRLSLTYYEQRQYAKALEVIKNAYRLAPECPLVIWDYAGTLDMLGETKKAIKMYRRLFSMGERVIACGDHGEGWDYAQSLLADCAFRISLCYLESHRPLEAWIWLLKHMSMRDQGAKSIYDEEEVRQVLKTASGFIPAKTSSGEAAGFSSSVILQRAPEMIQT
jgi:tetratricopeptide (TPR) repeat protein